MVIRSTFNPVLQQQPDRLRMPAVRPVFVPDGRLRKDGHSPLQMAGDGIHSIAAPIAQSRAILDLPEGATWATLLPEEH